MLDVRAAAVAALAEAYGPTTNTEPLVSLSALSPVVPCHSRRVTVRMWPSPPNFRQDVGVKLVDVAVGLGVVVVVVFDLGVDGWPPAAADDETL
jgi:hypothetical protein